MKKILVSLLVSVLVLVTVVVFFVNRNLDKKKLIFNNKAAGLTAGLGGIQQIPQNHQCRLAVSFQRGGANPSFSYMEELSKAAQSVRACSNYQSIYWDKVETSPGQFNWSVPDRYINIQYKYRIKPLGRLWMTPSFYSSAPRGKMSSSDYQTYSRFYAPKLANLDQWTRFVKLAANRYKGKINVWLLYHEPQEGLYFQTPGNYKHPIYGNEQRAGMGFKNFKDAAYYYYLTQRYGSTVIKDVSPKAKLYLTAFNPKYSQYLNFFYDLVRRPGFRNSFDIVREVTYAYRSLNNLNLHANKASTFYEGDKPGRQLSVALNQLSDEIRTNITSSESILHKLGINKKMFAETGVNSDLNGNYISDPKEERLQADILFRMIPAYLDMDEIGGLYIFRLANSDPNEPGMTEGQKVWRTLGLYKIFKQAGYHLKRPKMAAFSFRRLAQRYNNIIIDDSKNQSHGRYYYKNAPCEGLSGSSCVFDGRQVFQDKLSKKLYELVIIRDNLFIAPYHDNGGNREMVWKRINLKNYFQNVDPNSNFCDQQKANLPCLVDSISLRSLANGYIVSFTFEEIYGF